MSTSKLTRKQFISGGLMGGSALVVGSSILGRAAKPAFAQFTYANYYAIFTDFGSDMDKVKPDKGPEAHLDVAADTRASAGAGTDVIFNVYNQGGQQISEFHVPTSVDTGFSSSAADPNNNNLFSLTNGEPGLARVRVPVEAATSSAVLVQSGKSYSLLWNMSGSGVGSLFSVPVGKFNTASLLVANVVPASTLVNVSVGTTRAPGLGKYVNPLLARHALWRVDLQPDDQNSNLIVETLDTSPNIIVQLIIDNGQGVKGFSCPPVSFFD